MSSKTTAPAKTKTRRKRDLLHIDKKDPNSEYRWINRKKWAENGYDDWRGYEPVHENSKKNEMYQDIATSKTNQQKSRGSVIVRGDLMQAKIPKDLAEDYREEKEEKLQRKLRGISNPSIKARNLGEANPSVSIQGKNVDKKDLNVSNQD